MRYEGRWVDGHKIHKEWPSQGKGFTAIELLVVIACVAILAGLLIPVIRRMTNKDTTVIVPSSQAEKQEAFPSGQVMTKVPQRELESYLSKIEKRRVVSVTPIWELGGNPSHYLVITEPITERN